MGLDGVLSEDSENVFALKAEAVAAHISRGRTPFTGIATEGKASGARWPQPWDNMTEREDRILQGCTTASKHTKDKEERTGAWPHPLAYGILKEPGGC